MVIYEWHGRKCKLSDGSDKETTDDNAELNILMGIRENNLFSRLLNSRFFVSYCNETAEILDL